MLTQSKLRETKNPAGVSRQERRLVQRMMIASNSTTTRDLSVSTKAAEPTCGRPKITKTGEASHTPATSNRGCSTMAFEQLAPGVLRCPAVSSPGVGQRGLCETASEEFYLPFHRQHLDVSRVSSPQTELSRKACVCVRTALHTMVPAKGRTPGTGVSRVAKSASSRSVAGELVSHPGGGQDRTAQDTAVLGGGQ